MEIDYDNQEGKSYAPLINMSPDPHNDFQFKFEKFILARNSDSEDEDISGSSDDSNSEEEISNFEYSMHDKSSSSESYSLTTEDWSVINSAQYPELRKSLIMNRNVKYMTLQLFNKIKSLIVKNQEKIEALKKKLGKNESKEFVMYLGQLGAPYFKTKKDMFCSDPNKDTLNRRKRGLLPYYQIAMPPIWSKSDCETIIHGVQLTCQNKQNAMVNEITALTEKLRKEDKDSEVIPQIVDKIEMLEDELNNFKAILFNDIPSLSQNKFIDWEHISTEFLMDKHNAQSCSSFWQIYLHPDINKSDWTNEENEKIRLLAKKYKNQDWDRIAVELGTNRSGFYVFLHYSTVLCDQSTKSRFTEEEDKKLMHYVQCKKIGSFIPWNIISEFIPNRTKEQCKHRYQYFLSNLDQYTQGFSDAEDVLIVLLVERFGRNYMQFTKYLPTKSYMQIKSRYDNHLRISRMKGSFTLEEDKKILTHFSGTNTKIGPLIVSLNRNRLQVRQRYKKLKQFFNENPDKSLDHIRRGHGKKTGTFKRLEFLKYIGDQFKDCVDVPTIGEIERKLEEFKQAKDNQNIDLMLLNFFSTSDTFKERSLEITTPKINNAADKIYNILKSWRVNLEIPDEIRKNNMIDIIDVEILNILRYKYHSDIHTPSIDDLLPPNMNSLIGLRGLQLKFQIFKKSKFKSRMSLMDNLPPIRNDRDNQIACDLLSIFNKKDISTQCIIQNERSLFVERFISLFMWPALLSIEPPSEQISKLELRFKNSEQIINKKNDENKCKTKPMKRNLMENTNVPIIKKSKLDDENQHKFIQGQRFSSRLKNIEDITNENERIEVKQEFSAEESPRNVANVNECNRERLNEKNPKNPDQIEKTKFTSVKTYGKMKIIKNYLNEGEPQNLPPNLIKVDKSEIIKLLQNKKPIKIFKIQSIKNQDGTIIANKPSNKNINKTLEKTDKLIISENSGLLALENVMNNSKTKLISTGNSVVTGSNQIRKNINNFMDISTESGPFQCRNDAIHSSKSAKQCSESLTKRAEFNHTEDLNKLDAFLNNGGGDDYSIDLTENEVMKNEVGQLDQLIMQESSFDLTSF